MTIGALVRRVRSVTRAEWRDLLEAQAMLLLAAVELRVRRRGTVVSTEVTPLPVATPARSRGAASAWRAAWAVDRAARHGLTRPLCLTRAVALRRMLHARGFTHADVRVGVVKRASGFEAHAWVVCGDVVFDSAPGAASEFVALDRVQVRAGV